MPKSDRIQANPQINSSSPNGTQKIRKVNTRKIYLLKDKNVYVPHIFFHRNDSLFKWRISKKCNQSKSCVRIENLNIKKMESKIVKNNDKVEEPKVRCVVKRAVMKFMKFIGEVREKMNLEGQFLLDEPRGRLYT